MSYNKGWDCFYVGPRPVPQRSDTQVRQTVTINVLVFRAVAAATFQGGPLTRNRR